MPQPQPSLEPLKKGTRIRKKNFEKGDAHQVGDTGTVTEKMGFKGRYAYCISWDDMPDVPVWIADHRIELNEYVLARSIFDRWLIVSSTDRNRAWSGSRWVNINGTVQTCNFETEKEANEYAKENGLIEMTHE